MNQKQEKYRRLTESSEYDGSIFSEAWWLDATCGKDKWDVSIVEKNYKVVGALPFLIKKNKNKIVIGQPQLTQNLGPWIKSDSKKGSSLLAFEKDVFNELIDQLPNHDLFVQNFHHKRTNWLPFYWRGFSQSTFYTYVIDDLRSDQVWTGLQSNIKTDINKARNRFALEIRESTTIDPLLDLVEATFKRQNSRAPYSREYARCLAKASLERNRGKILLAQDNAGRNHAGAFIVWDNRQAYYLIGGGDPELRNSGAGSLCLFEAIVSCASVTKSFDFEGSMIEPIERFFRAFGGRQVPYFHVSKFNSKSLKAKHFLKQILMNK